MLRGLPPQSSIKAHIIVQVTADPGLVLKQFNSDEDETEEEKLLKEFWVSISPPVEEESIVGKWFVAVYKFSKRKKIMCIGRCIQRFLLEKDGPVSQLQLDCLKPHIGADCIVDAYPEGQSDCYIFNMEDIFGGPLEFSLPPKKRAYRFPGIFKAKDLFKRIKDLDRASIKKKFLDTKCTKM